MSDSILLSSKLGLKDEWEKWSREIPSIEFPAGWKIQVIPPMVGAIVRFRVSFPNDEEQVSIYLDCYNRLGFFGEPYWEVYPYKGDVGRCAMKDVDKLLEMIGDRSE